MNVLYGWPLCAGRFVVVLSSMAVFAPQVRCALQECVVSGSKFHRVCYLQQAVAKTRPSHIKKNPQP